MFINRHSNRLWFKKSRDLNPPPFPNQLCLWKRFFILGTFEMKMLQSPWADDCVFAGTQMNDVKNLICRLVNCKVPLYPLNLPKDFRLCLHLSTNNITQNKRSLRYLTTSFSIIALCCNNREANQRRRCFFLQKREHFSVHGVWNLSGGSSK